MRHFIQFGLTFMLFVATADGKTKPLPEVRRVVALNELTPDMTKELIAGMYPDTAIECKEGSALPIRYLFNCRILSVQYDPKLTVKIEAPCYLRFSEKKSFISLDLVHWEKAKNFFKGYLDTQLKMSSDKSHILVESHLIECD